MTNDIRERRVVAGTWTANAGLLLVMVAVAMPILRLSFDIYRYVFAAGAALVLIGRIITPAPEGASARLRRFCRMELWVALLFCASVFCMFYPGMGPTDWLAFTLAGGICQVYASIMIPRLKSREGLKK